jgi:long-chain acyl-CoA synthetase
MTDNEGIFKGKILSGARALGQSQLLGNVARAAAGFAAAGIGFEDTVAIMLRNDFPFFEASMAANSLGAHAVPINWHFQAGETGYILDDSQAKALVLHADLWPQIRAAIPEHVQV